MADERRLPARHSSRLPSVLQDVTASDHLPSGSHFSFGTQAWILERRKRLVNRSTELMVSQASQSAAYAGLLDARVRVAEKFGEVSDLPSQVAEQQREREHRRTLSENRRLVSIELPSERLVGGQSDYARQRGWDVRNVRHSPPRPTLVSRATSPGAPSPHDLTKAPQHTTRPRRVAQDHLVERLKRPF